MQHLPCIGGFFGVEEGSDKRASGFQDASQFEKHASVRV